MPIPTERRKYQRVVMTRPLPGRLGGARVYVLDASLIGLRIAHQGSAPPAGSPCSIEFEWEGRLIELECEVRRNALHKLAKSANEKSIYHAGLAITGAVGDSDSALRGMIAAIVARALDEQKANARGVPAAAAQYFQTGKGTEYVRCELVGGAWRRTETSRADQPPNGFTVSAEESREHVEMLCDTFVNADDAGRQLIRMMAELSISKAEGVPTRRYTP
ncbi:MAG TPA: PilZ domain-containing protein [Thermoanaerobaculia bacterium]